MNVTLSGSLDGKTTTVRLTLEPDQSISVSIQKGTRSGGSSTEPPGSFAPLDASARLDQLVDEWMGKGLAITGDTRMVAGPAFTARVEVPNQALAETLESFQCRSDLANGLVGLHWRLRNKGSTTTMTWRYIAASVDWQTVDAGIALLMKLCDLTQDQAFQAVPTFQLSLPEGVTLDVPGHGLVGQASGDGDSIDPKAYLTERRKHLAPVLMDRLYEMNVFIRPFDPTRAFGASAEVFSDPFAACF